MRKEDISSKLTVLAFDFFYWFSRFEFALKENGYLKSTAAGAAAMPGWKCFVDKWALHYVLSTEAAELLALGPQQQVINANGDLDWKQLDLTKCSSKLDQVTLLLKTVRNNLFHGGKHGVASWDDETRTNKLLTLGKTVLDQLSAMASLEADYSRYY